MGVPAGLGCSVLNWVSLGYLGSSGPPGLLWDTLGWFVAVWGVIVVRLVGGCCLGLVWVLFTLSSLQNAIIHVLLIYEYLLMTRYSPWQNVDVFTC